MEALALAATPGGRALFVVIVVRCEADGSVSPCVTNLTRALKAASGEVLHAGALHAPLFLTSLGFCRAFFYSAKPASETHAAVPRESVSFVPAQCQHKSDEKPRQAALRAALGAVRVHVVLLGGATCANSARMAAAEVRVVPLAPKPSTPLHFRDGLFRCHAGRGVCLLSAALS